VTEEEPLRRVTVTARDEGGWTVVRERASTGETYHVDDLLDAFESVSNSYRPDGTARPWPPGNGGEDGCE
jgi:hypothetical protein